jgi:Tol biopolymer transport system component/DNA-binding winged helix-turn-helix (wHTH) protein
MKQAHPAERYPALYQTQKYLPTTNELSYNRDIRFQGSFLTETRQACLSKFRNFFGKDLETPNVPKNGTSTSGRRYLFDDFVLDPENRTLTRAGESIPLTGKIFDILLAFAENSGRLLDKDELIAKVWNGSFVEESNLARNVSTLRKALGDTGKEHKYIATVQGRGYRFQPVVTRGDDLNGSRPIAPPKSPPRDKTSRLVMIIAAVAAVSLIAIVVIFWPRSNRSFTSTISTIGQIRLTTGGKASRAVISPDGNTVIYTENEELKSRNLSNGATTVLAGAVPELNYISLALTPDGEYIYFSARRSRSVVSLFRMPIGGGEQQWIIDSVYGGISFSPDGTRFVFVRRYPELNEYALLIANADGTNVRSIAGSQRPNNFDGTPSWSPDGATILCAAISTEGGFHFSIVAIDAASGFAQPIATKRWAWVGSLAWLPDSRNLIIVAQDENAVNAQVWRLDRATGEAARISDDSFIYESVSATRDGEKFVAIKKRLESHVWIDVNDALTQLTTGFDKYDGVGGLDWEPGDRLIYHSRASGKDAIWRVNGDGTGAEELTPDGGGGFAVSPDGRFLVFQKAEAKGLGLSRLDLTNGDQKRITENSTDMTPHFSPDGRSIVYGHFAERHSINKISVDGGEPTKLFDEYRTVSSPSVSPDGTRIAFAFGRTQGDTIRSGIAIIAVDGSQVLQTFDVNLNFGTIYEHPTVQWSADGMYLYHVKLDGGVSNVWKIDVGSGQTSPVTQFNTGRIFNFAFSRDGSRIALARGNVESDVLVLRLQNSS